MDTRINSYSILKFSHQHWIDPSSITCFWVHTTLTWQLYVDLSRQPKFPDTITLHIFDAWHGLTVRGLKRWIIAIRATLGKEIINGYGWEGVVFDVVLLETQVGVCSNLDGCLGQSVWWWTTLMNPGSITDDVSRCTVGCITEWNLKNNKNTKSNRLKCLLAL